MSTQSQDSVPADHISADDLSNFEKEVADIFATGAIRAPVHLRGGREQQLIDLFREYRINHDDYVYGYWDAHELALDDVVPGGTKKNMKYLEDKMTVLCATPKYKIMYCDAQTSGGLLIAMNKHDAKEYIKRVEDLTFGYASIIGEVIPRAQTPIIIH